MKSFVITVFSGMFLLISGQSLAGDIEKVSLNAEVVGNSKSTVPSSSTTLEDNKYIGTSTLSSTVTNV